MDGVPRRPQGQSFRKSVGPAVNLYYQWHNLSGCLLRLRRVCTCQSSTYRIVGSFNLRSSECDFGRRQMGTAQRWGI